LRALALIADADGSLGRLAEGHLDALAIMAELSAPPADDRLRGVWAARPELLQARPTQDGWRLTGTKPWCSGGEHLDRALLTATDPDGVVRLFDVDVAAVRFADDWHPIGMRASDSRTGCLEVEVAASDQIGPPGAYVARPGFWHGGIGVAACWHGLATRIGRDLADHAARRDDPFARAAAGRVAASLAASRSLLAAAGRQIDRHPADDAAARRRAPLVRVGVAEAARTVLDTSIIVQGASALCFDAGHGRAITDLTVYLGQLHHGTDAATIDPAGDDDWWTA
jgi:alkylation response protein AidB-like acyl-CoA dehydrogenase